MSRAIDANKDIMWGSSTSPQLTRLLEQEFVRVVPRKPIALPRFDSTSLPDPAAYEGCLIYCPDTQQFRGSNGVTWGVL